MLSSLVETKVLTAISSHRRPKSKRKENERSATEQSAIERVPDCMAAECLFALAFAEWLPPA
jgi:hypothetical protein